MTNKADLTSKVEKILSGNLKATELLEALPKPDSANDEGISPNTMREKLALAALVALMLAAIGLPSDPFTKRLVIKALATIAIRKVTQKSGGQEEQIADI